MVANDNGVSQPQEKPSLATPSSSKKPAQRTMPKWEVDTRERVRSAIRKYAVPLQGLLDRDANEGDTRLFVTDFLYEGLGFDKYTDLTTEYMVKGDFADYGIRIDKQMVAFIEVKRIATKLDSKHLKQVEMYAVNEGVEWVILTNGVHWKVYHITGGLPMILDLAIEVNLLGEESPQKKADKLFYLTKESFKKHQIDDVWKAQRATSPRSFLNVILSPVVVAMMQKELKKQTGHSVEIEEIERLLRTTVLRPECFEKS
jgi:predicted type IV restriction endonuclease